MTYKGLLFDVDGVLVNSEKLRVEYFQKTFKEKNIVAPKYLFSELLGKTTPVFLQEAAENEVINESLVKPLLEEYNSLIKQNYPYNVEPIKITVEFITKYIGDSKIGFATVNTRNKALEVLKYLNIEKFSPTIVAREDVIKLKPDPECYLNLAKMLELEPTECAVIEDTANGATASIKAGIDCYILLNSYNNEDEFKKLNIKGYISTIQDLEDLAL